MLYFDTPIFIFNWHLTRLREDLKQRLGDGNSNENVTKQNEL